MASSGNGTTAYRASNLIWVGQHGGLLESGQLTSGYQMEWLYRAVVGPIEAILPDRPIIEVETDVEDMVVLLPISVVILPHHSLCKKV